MSSPVALVCTHPKPSAGRLAPAWGSRVTSQPAGQEGLEPPTAGFGDRDSSQLSYCPVAARPRQVPAGQSPSTVVRARTNHLVDRHQLLKSTLPGPPPSNHARTSAAFTPATPDPPG